MPLPACRMADVPFPNGTVRAESLCRPAADLAVVLAVVLAAILAAILAATLLPTSLLTSLLILSARHLLLASAAACQRGSAHLPVRPLASASAPRVHMNACQRVCGTVRPQSLTCRVLSRPLPLTSTAAAAAAAVAAAVAAVNGTVRPAVLHFPSSFIVVDPQCTAARWRPRDGRKARRLMSL